MSQIIRYYPVHIPLGLAIIILQSTLLAKTGHQNILIVLILHLGGTAHFLSGGILTLFFGLIQDTLSGSPAGLSSLFYLFIFFAGSLLRRGLAAGHPFFQMGLVFLSGGFLYLFLSWVIGSAFPSVMDFLSVLFTALISPFLFNLFNLLESLYSNYSHPKSID